MINIQNIAFIFPDCIDYHSLLHPGADESASGCYLKLQTHINLSLILRTNNLLKYIIRGLGGFYNFHFSPVNHYYSGLRENECA